MPGAGILKNSSDVKRGDKVIIIMGKTGCGKSNFVDRLTQTTDWSKSSLSSGTVNVCAARTKIPQVDPDVVIVDTPGFDDTTRSDLEILSLISEWLGKFYKNNCNLTGILYLHPILDNRFGEHSRRNLYMFKKLFGHNSLTQVIFVTTMWDQIPLGRGERREQELRDLYLEPWLDLGARTERFDNQHTSAQRIVSRLVSQGQIISPLGVPDAAKALASQRLSDLTKEKEVITTLKQNTKNPSQYDGEDDRIATEISKTLEEAKKLSLWQRFTSLFGKQKKKRKANGGKGLYST